MVADEALLLYTFDGAASPPRFVFHTAVDTGGDGTPRKSTEVRCLGVISRKSRNGIMPLAGRSTYGSARRRGGRRRTTDYSWAA